MENSGLIDCTRIETDKPTENENYLSDLEDVVPYENKTWLSSVTSAGVIPVLGAPLSEIFSVKVYCNSFAHRKTCEVYGEIKVMYEDGTSYALYSRNLNDAETITVGQNNLSIDIPDKCYVSSTLAQLSISLKDRIDQSLIIEYDFKFDKLTERDYDKVKSLQLHGAGGYACIKYATFFAAVVAYVQVIIDKKDESDNIVPVLADTNFTVKIVARYGNTYGNKLPGILLFNKFYDFQVSPSPIDLSREVVVVPAYSLLRVDVDVYDSHSHKPLVSFKRDSQARFRGMSCLFLENEDFCIEVEMLWFHPDDLEKPLSYHKISDEPVGLAILRREPPYRRHCGLTLIEVFGFMICHNDNGVVEICGKIDVFDPTSMHHVLFERDELNPEILSSNRETIPIKGPSKCYNGPNGFGILIDLWDIQGQILIKGDLGWNHDTLVEPVSWYDRRKCSVSAGVNGYAVVFYTVFSKAVQALVKVMPYLPDEFSDDEYKVYGTIIAFYDNEDYSTEYEKTYFRSVLFKKSRENSIKLVPGCELSLLKSVIAVPTVASLVVELDLCVSSQEFGEEHLQGITSFDFEDGTLMSPVIKGENYYFNISVDWSRFYK